MQSINDDQEIKKAKKSVDPSWLAALPLGGWFLAYCYTYGQYVRVGIPTAFLEVTLVRVLQATLAFLVLLLTMGQLVEHLRKRKKSVLPEVRFWIVIQLLFLAIALCFSSSGMRWDAFGRLLGFYAMLWLPYILYAWPQFVDRVLSATTHVLTEPTLTRILDLVVAALLAGGLAYWLGWSAYFVGSDYVVIDSACGPLTRVLASSNGFLTLKLPDAAGANEGVQFLSISDAKGITFRDSTWSELNFRNSKFEGPCSPVAAAIQR